MNADELPEAIRLFVVARPGIAGAQPAARPPLRFDPTHVASLDFLRLVEKLDRAAYGAAGLAFPRWALYDCAELPGAVFGLCAPASALSRAGRTVFGVEDGAAHVPVTLLVAIPTLEPGAWFVYSICGLDEVAPTGLPNLRPVTLTLATGWLGAREILGVFGWAGDRIDLFAHRGRVRLLAAWMPTHDVSASCAFRCSLGTRGPIAGAREARDVHVGRPEALQALQREIEAGAELFVDGPLRVDVTGRFVRVVRSDP